MCVRSVLMCGPPVFIVGAPVKRKKNRRRRNVCYAVLVSVPKSEIADPPFWFLLVSAEQERESE